MFGLLKNLFNYNEKIVNRHRQRVLAVNNLEPEYQRLSDADLARKTVEFRERLDRGADVDSLLPEAFATVREAARRTLGQRHYDVQLIGGMVLHDGNVAEMKTGEGKTLVATLPSYLNALPGNGVHVITVNDYLARRDAEWMGQIYRYLGMQVGLIVHGLDNTERRASYAADITYGTNNEFGFDYLRDNMCQTAAETVQRRLNYAIVDESDSILIDEARTPLIISGPSEKPTELYYTFAKIAERLKPEEDYTVDEKTRQAAPTEEGVAKVEKMMGVQHMYEDSGSKLSHYLNNAIKAKELFQRDSHYVVKDGQVIIVDEFTGRLMFGRRWSDGLHQAVEAKENVKIERESQTLATITIQNYFRMYQKLAGMTGTAKTEENEFREIYNMDVVVIPTNRPMVRADNPDVVYKTIKAKYEAVVEEIAERHQSGQPLLVGTVSIEKSERISEMLKRRGVPHQVLNAKFHEKEAEIVAQAGRLGVVTIATNMAGRGTDIVLGGNPGSMARERMRQRGYTPEQIAEAGEGLHSEDPEVRPLQDEYRDYFQEFEAACRADGDKVRAAGGLHIIGTERHEARRIDNQLRGRSGRQGDPGSTRFYVALEDDLMRLFGGEMVSGLMDRLKIPDDTPIDHPMVSRALENAQKKVEARNFDARKHLLMYDNVANEQRELIYKQRRRVLEGEGLREAAIEAVAKLVDRLVDESVPDKQYMEEWDPQALIDAGEEAFLPQGALTAVQLKGLDRAGVREYVHQLALNLYEEKEARLGADVMRHLERVVFLRVVDEKWMDHLAAMDDLRDGIGLRALAQRDPAIEYKVEAYDMFNHMIAGIQEDVVRFLFRLEVVREQEQPRRRVMVESGPGEAAPAQVRPVRVAQRVGRNEPCPCGSGKKYKHCHGREAV